MSDHNFTAKLDFRIIDVSDQFYVGLEQKKLTAYKQKKLQGKSSVDNSPGRRRRKGFDEGYKLMCRLDFCTGYAANGSDVEGSWFGRCQVLVRRHLLGSLGPIAVRVHAP